MTHLQRKSGGCEHGCKSCGRLLDNVSSGAATGWRLVLGAAGIFLVPLLAALAGVMLAGDSPDAQVAAGGGAFLLAAGVAAGVARRMRSGKGVCDEGRT